MYDKNINIEDVISGMKRFLSVRERCKNEINQYLRKKGYDSETIFSVLAALSEENLIDDRRFAKNRIYSRMHKGYGPFYIKSELNSLKISHQIINNLLEEISEEEFLEGAFFIIDRKLPSLMAEEKSEDKLYRILKTKGFTDSLCRRALELAKEKYPHWAHAKTVSTVHYADEF